MKAEVIPTDTVQIPAQENCAAVEDLIQQALQNRPDYIQQKVGLKNSQINLEGSRNGLLPTVDLDRLLRSTSQAGVQNPGVNCRPWTRSPTTGCLTSWVNTNYWASAMRLPICSIPAAPTKA